MSKYQLKNFKIIIIQKILKFSLAVGLYKDNGDHNQFLDTLTFLPVYWLKILAPPSQELTWKKQTPDFRTPKFHFELVSNFESFWFCKSNFNSQAVGILNFKRRNFFYNLNFAEINFYNEPNFHLQNKLKQRQEALQIKILICRS